MICSKFKGIDYPKLANFPILLSYAKKNEEVKAYTSSVVV